MTKLNPCPDCGREPVFQEGDSGFAIGCESCDSIVIVASKSANGAMNAWNAATSEPQSVSTEKTLRDEFAMRCPFTSEEASRDLRAKGIETTFGNISDWLAAANYIYADAMLKERNK